MPAGQTGAMTLPADGHVHSEWSWDARLGSMEGTCARAVERGLPAIAFTEHVDFTPFRAGALVGSFGPLVHEGILTAPQLDVDGYLAGVERCRASFPDLRILTGLEVGQPHRHPEQVAALLARGPFDRVLGSLHCMPDGDAFAEPFTLFPDRPVEPAFRQLLTETARMVETSPHFTVLAHIDYPVRSWPADAEPFDPINFEVELRRVLAALAATERALEINTKVPLHPTVLRWWREEGGRQVTFGSDAHEPWRVGRGLAEAADLASAHGFAAGRRPEDPWVLAR